MASAEASLQERGVLVDALEARLLQTELEKSQLEDQVGSIHVLLEASQSREEDDDEVVRGAGVHRTEPACPGPCCEGACLGRALLNPWAHTTVKKHYFTDIYLPLMKC